MNWKEWDKLVKKVIQKIRKARYKPDILVPFMKGGLLPGGIIAARLKMKDVRPVSIGRRGKERYFIHPKGGKIGKIKGTKILIIEDDVPTGRSVKFAKRHFLAQGVKEVKVACVFKYKGVKGVDFFAKEVKKFPKYPWKITHLGERR